MANSLTYDFRFLAYFIFHLQCFYFCKKSISVNFYTLINREFYNFTIYVPFSRMKVQNGTKNRYFCAWTNTFRFTVTKIKHVILKLELERYFKNVICSVIIFKILSDVNNNEYDGERVWKSERRRGIWFSLSGAVETLASPVRFGIVLKLDRWTSVTYTAVEFP